MKISIAILIWVILFAIALFVADSDQQRRDSTPKSMPDDTNCIQIEVGKDTTIIYK